MKVRSYHTYTEEQVEYLREISPTRKSKDIAKKFNERFGLDLTVRKVSETRNRHKIPSKFSHLNSGEGGVFQKGQQSWNKDKTGYMGANRTSFKEGCIPPNRVPIGTERKSKDGYLEIKVTDGKGNKNWKAKHRLIWENHNGDIPDRHVIIFGDRDIRNFDIDNLLSISRKQLVRLNKGNMIQKDTALTKAAIKIVDLDYKINELEG